MERAAVARPCAAWGEDSALLSWPGRGKLGADSGCRRLSFEMEVSIPGEHEPGQLDGESLRLRKSFPICSMEAKAISVR